MSSAIAFDRPGGDYASRATGALPIDLPHLARQTMGDRSLEQEILGLFAQQISGIAARMEMASDAERAKLAHGLKGAATAVGAFSIAECAIAIMDQPSQTKNLTRLTRRVDAVLAFIARFTR